MTRNKFTNMRLDDKEDEIITAKSEEMGISKAAAIRLIIREWAQMRKNFVTVPVKATIVEDGVIKVDPKYWETPDGIDQSR